jgi:hypothetical protein
MLLETDLVLKVRDFINRGVSSGFGGGGDDRIGEQTFSGGDCKYDGFGGGDGSGGRAEIGDGGS